MSFARGQYRLADTETLVRTVDVADVNAAPEAVQNFTPLDITGADYADNEKAVLAAVVIKNAEQTVANATLQVLSQELNLTGTTGAPEIALKSATLLPGESLTVIIPPKRRRTVVWVKRTDDAGTIPALCVLDYVIAP